MSWCERDCDAVRRRERQSQKDDEADIVERERNGEREKDKKRVKGRERVIKAERKT